MKRDSMMNRFLTVAITAALVAGLWPNGSLGAVAEELGSTTQPAASNPVAQSDEPSAGGADTGSSAADAASPEVASDPAGAATDASNAAGEKDAATEAVSSDGAQPAEGAATDDAPADSSGTKTDDERAGDEKAGDEKAEAAKTDAAKADDAKADAAKADAAKDDEAKSNDGKADEAKANDEKATADAAKAEADKADAEAHKAEAAQKVAATIANAAKNAAAITEAAKLPLDKAPEGVDSSLAAGVDLSSRRLLVAGLSRGDFTEDTQVLSEWGGLFLTQYDTVERTRNAYLYYKGARGASLVAPDVSISAADDGAASAARTQGEKDAKATEGAPDPDAAAVSEALSADSAAAGAISSVAKSVTGSDDAANAAVALAKLDGESLEKAKREVRDEAVKRTQETPEGGMTADDNPLSELSGELASGTSAGGYTIALIDTGYTGAGVVDSASMLGASAADDNGHGSAMAAHILEADPGASIVSVKALDASGTGTVSSVYAALKYAQAAGVDVINLSMSAWATDENSLVRDAIQEAASSGIIVVGAAGNSGTDASYTIPGGVGAALVTGSADETGARLAGSNYGATVDAYVRAGSTSEAAARMSGWLSAGSVADWQGALAAAIADGTFSDGSARQAEGPGEGQPSEEPAAEDGDFRASANGNTYVFTDSNLVATAVDKTNKTITINGNVIKNGDYLIFNGSDFKLENQRTTGHAIHIKYDLTGSSQDGIAPGTTQSLKPKNQSFSISSIKITSGGTNNSITITGTLKAIDPSELATPIAVTFDRQGGTGGSGNIYYDADTEQYYSDASHTQSMSAVSIPTKTGYDFQGYWTQSGKKGTQYVSKAGSLANYGLYKQKPDGGSMTLYAAWSARSFDITLDGQGNDSGKGGTSHVYYTFNSNAYYSDSAHKTKIDKITIPEKTGYDFGGYYTEKSGNGKCYISSSGAFTNDFYKVDHSANTDTLYAKWTAKTIKVTLDGRSAKTAGTTAVWYKYNTNKYYSDSGCKNQIASIAKPTKDGYTFAGYKVPLYDDNGRIKTDNKGNILYGTTYINSSGSFTNNLYKAFAANATLHAQWTPNVINVTLDPQFTKATADEGQGSANVYYSYKVDAYYGTYASNKLGNSFDDNGRGALKGKVDVPVRRGHTFGGYYTEKNGGGTQYVDADGTINRSLCGKFSSKATLYAKWTPNFYDLHLDARLGENFGGEKTDSQGTEYIYEQFGVNVWKKKATAGGVTTGSDAMSTSANPIEIPQNHFVVTYDANVDHARADESGEQYKVATTSGTLAGELDDAAARAQFAGYFGGTANATTGVVSYGTTQYINALGLLTSNLTNTTFYTKSPETLYAKWNPNGEVTLPTPTMTGYTFKEWRTGDRYDRGTSAGAGGATYKPGDDVKLYGIWTPNDIHVTLDTTDSELNGGDGKQADIDPGTTDVYYTYDQYCMYEDASHTKWIGGYGELYTHKDERAGILVPKKAGRHFEGYFDQPTEGTQYILGSTGAYNSDYSAYVTDGVGKFVKAADEVNDNREWPKITCEKTEDTTLYAQWSPSSYEVLVDAAGGLLQGHSNLEPVMPGYATGAHESLLARAKYGTEFKVNTPVKKGYTFDGWVVTGMDDTGHEFRATADDEATVTNAGSYETAADVTLFDKLTGVDAVGKVTLTAKWKPNRYTVHLNSDLQQYENYVDGKNFVPSEGSMAADDPGTTGLYYTFNADEYYTDPAQTETTTGIKLPQKAGYTFCGYYTGTTKTKGEMVGGQWQDVEYVEYGTRYIMPSGGLVNDSSDSPVVQRKMYEDLGAADNYETQEFTLYAKWEPAIYEVMLDAYGMDRRYNEDGTIKDVNPVLNLDGEAVVPTYDEHGNVFNRVIPGASHFMYEKYGVGFFKTYEDAVSETNFIGGATGSGEHLEVPYREGLKFGGYADGNGTLLIGSGGEIRGEFEYVDGNTEPTLVNVPLHPKYFVSNGTLYGVWTAENIRVMFSAGDANLGLRAETHQDILNEQFGVGYFRQYDQGVWTDRVTGVDALPTCQDTIINFWSADGTGTNGKGTNTPQTLKHNFLGYFLDEPNGDGSDMVVDANGNFTPERSSGNLLGQSGLAVLYAHWDNTTVTLPQLTRDGYEFDGWETRADSWNAIEEHWWADGSSPIKFPAGQTSCDLSDLYHRNDNGHSHGHMRVLVAQWKPLSTEITLDKRGGTGGADKVYEQFGKGFFDSDGLEDSSRLTLDSADGRRGITKPTMSYEMTYNENGGSFSEGAAPTDAQKTDSYEFAGYFTSAAGGTQFVTPEGYLATTADDRYFTGESGTLYAQWTPRPVSLPAAPAKTGYTFTGWSDGENTYAPGAAYTATKPTTMTAQWKPNEYEVRYEANADDATGSTSASSHTYDAEGGSLSQNGFEREGYDFSGWNTKADGTGDHYEGGQTGVGNLGDGTGEAPRLYAEWTPKQFPVTLDGRGTTSNGTFEQGTGKVYENYADGYYKTQTTDGAGKTSVSDKLEGDAAIEKPSLSYAVSYDAKGGAFAEGEPTTAQTSASYDFNGYYTATSGGTKYIDENGRITADAQANYFASEGTLHAQWTPQGVTLPAPTREGYVFNGWKGGEGTLYDAGATYVPTDNTSFAAQWEGAAYTVRQVLNYDGAANPADIEARFSDVAADATLGIAAPVRDGYEFAGWTVTGVNGGASAKAGDATIADGATTSATTFQNLRSTEGVVTLTANWVRPIAVALDANAGTGILASVGTTKLYELYGEGIYTNRTDKTYALSAPTRTDGYVVRFDGGAQKFADDSPTKGDTTMTAVWTYNGYNTKQNKSDEGNVELIDAAGKPTAAFANTYYPDVDASAAPTLYADWAMGAVTLPTATAEPTVTPATEEGGGPTTTNYVLLGWGTRTETTAGNTDPENPKPAEYEYVVTHAAGEKYVPAADGETLYAVWSEAPVEFDITYDLAEGALAEGVDNPAKAYVGQKFAVSQPTRDGFEFEGWKIKKAKGEGLASEMTGVDGKAASYLFDDSAIDSDGYKVTFTATWKPRVYTITLDANGGTGGTERFFEEYGTRTYVSKGDPILPLLEPSYVYSLVAPTREYNVTYNTNGGSVTTTDANLKAQSAFQGYYTAKSGGDEVLASTLASVEGLYYNRFVSEDTTLYARWADGTVTLPSGTKLGYALDGWYGDANLDNLVGRAGETKPVAPNAILYAKWNPNTYKVAYAGMEGASYPTSYATTATYGTAFSVGEPTKHGYVFDGWTVSGMSDLAADDKHVIGTSEVTGDKYGTATKATSFKNLSSVQDATVTLTANWTKTEAYDITLRTDNVTDGSVSVGSVTTLFERYDEGLYKTRTGEGTEESPYAYANKFNDAGSALTGGELPTRSYAVGYDLNAAGSDAAFVGDQLIGGDGADKDQLKAGHTKATYPFRGYFTADKGGTMVVGSNGEAVLNPTEVVSGGFFRAATDLWAQWGTGSVTLPGATRTGYTIDGWYAEAACTTRVGSPADTHTPSANGTLFAKWRPNTYDIKYDLAGGVHGATHPGTATYDAEAFTLSNPTRPGYVFAGWTAEGVNGGAAAKAGSDPWDGTKAITETTFKNLNTGNDESARTVTFTATWTALEYTLNLSAPDATTKAAGTENPGGWTPALTERYEDGVYNGTAKMTPAGDGEGAGAGAVTKPERTYTVTYDPEGKGGGADAASRGAFGEGQTRDENTVAAYAFGGYYTQASGGTQIIDADGKVVSSPAAVAAGAYFTEDNTTARTGEGATGREATLYARWTSAYVTLPEAPQTKPTYTYTEDGAEKTGAKVFVGWATRTDTAQAGQPAAYEYSIVGQPGDAYAPDAGNTDEVTHSATLYAVWRTGQFYTVSYDANGGENPPASQRREAGTDETVVISGATWGEGADGSAGTADGDKMTRDDSSIDGYTVNFDLNGGRLTGTDLAPVFTQKRFGRYATRYDFDVWNTLANPTPAQPGTAYAPGTSYGADASLSLFAQWSETHAWGKVKTPGVDEVAYIEGYRLAGWNTKRYEDDGRPVEDYLVKAGDLYDPTGTYVPVGADAAARVNPDFFKGTGTVGAGDFFDATDARRSIEELTDAQRNITLYAVWSGKVVDLALANKGKSYDAGSDDYVDVVINNPFDPAAGATGGSNVRDVVYAQYLTGYSNSCTGTEEEHNRTLGDVVTSITPIPQRAYTVTYESQDDATDRAGGLTGTVAVDATSGHTQGSETVTYTFDGYAKSPDGSAGRVTDGEGNVTTAFSKAPFTANATLYTTWKEDVLTVTLPTLTRENYVFGGWYRDAECSEANKVGDGGDAFAPSEIARTLYAKWTPKTYEVSLVAKDATGTGHTDKVWEKYATGVYLDADATRVLGEENRLVLPERSYTVGIDTNGGSYAGATFAGADLTATVDYAFNGYYSAPSLGKRLVRGAAEVDNDFKDVATAPSSTYFTETSSPRELYAQWTEGTVALPTAAELTRTGYELKGFSATKAAKEATFAPGSSFAPAANTTLYAVWAENVYEVTLDDRLGDDSADTTAGSGVAYERYGTGFFTDSAATESPVSGVAAPSKRYVVTFRNNDGTDAASVRSSEVSFAGYYTQETGGAQVTDGNGAFTTAYVGGEGFSSDVTVYGRWGAAAAVEAPTPTREGHKLKGWATTAGATKPDVTLTDGAYAPTADTTLYAVWEGDVYPVMLNGKRDESTSAGTETIYERYGAGYYTDEAATRQMTIDSNAVALPTSTHIVTYKSTVDGVEDDLAIKTATATDTFDGYFTQEKGGTRYVDASGMLTAEASNTYFEGPGALFAQWTDGTVELPTLADKTKVEEDPNAGGPVTVTTHYFVGWSTVDPDRADTPPTSGATGTYAVSEDVTLHAVWVDATKYRRYYIDYSGLDGVDAASFRSLPTVVAVLAEDDSSSVTIENPAKSGSEFAGWSIAGMTDADHVIGGTLVHGTTLPEGGLTKATVFENVHDGKGSDKAANTVTLTATWQVPVHAITLDDNGGAGGSGVVYERYGDAYYADAEATRALSGNAGVAVPTKAGFTATFEANAGSAAGVAVPNPVTSANAFDGYYTTASGGTQLVSADGTLTASASATYFEADGTLFARWTQGTVSLGSATWAGHRFLGWNTSADGTGTAYGAGDVVTLAGDVTLFAQWEKPSYLMAYHANGGDATTLPSSAKVDEGASYTLDGTPDKPAWATDETVPGYAVTFDKNLPTGGETSRVTSSKLSTTHEFQGWNTKADGTGAKYAKGATVESVSSALTFFAQWKSETVSDPVALPAAPAYANHTFLGWSKSPSATSADPGLSYADGRYANDTYVPAGDETLYAVWKADELQITLDGRGATSSGHTASVRERYGKGYFDAAEGVARLSYVTPPERSYKVTFQDAEHADTTFDVAYAFGGYWSGDASAGADTVGGRQLTDAAGAFAGAYANGTFSETATTAYAAWAPGSCTAPTPPEVPGKTFKGWKLNETTVQGGDVVTPATDETYVAVWEPVVYDVTLDAGVEADASAARTEHLWEAYGTALYKSKTGEGGATAYSDDLLADGASPIAIPTGRTYTVTLNPNAEGYVPPEGFDASLEGRPAFKGYYSKATRGAQLVDASGAATDALGPKYFGADATIFAQWDKATVELPTLPNRMKTVRVPRLDEGGQPVLGEGDEPIYDDVEKVGYFFAGWSETNPAGTDPAVTSGYTGTYAVDPAKADAAGGLTLYAVWLDAELYSGVFFIKYAGLDDVSDDYVANLPVVGVAAETGSSSVTVANPTRPGFYFTGWDVTGDKGGDQAATEDGKATVFTDLHDGQGKTPEENTVTLTAKWAPSEYVVGLDDQGATTAASPEAIYQNGNAFYRAAGGDAENRMTATDNGVTPPRLEHKVTYRSNDGTEVDKLGTTTRVDVARVFGGYYTAENAAGDQVIDGTGHVTPTFEGQAYFGGENDKIYAAWSGGYTTVASGPTRAGYRFLGWNTVAAPTVENPGVSYIPGQSLLPEADLLLYAQWEPSVYVIAFDNLDATTPGTSVLYEKGGEGYYTSHDCAAADRALVLPQIPVRSYRVTLLANDGTGTTRTVPAIYDFAGYYTSDASDAQQVTDGYGSFTDAFAMGTFESNATLTARWTGGRVTLPSAAAMVREGYRLTGWTDAAGTVHEPGATVTPTADDTFAAQWEPMVYEVTLDNRGANTKGTERLWESYGSALYADRTGGAGSYEYYDDILSGSRIERPAKSAKVYLNTGVGDVIYETKTADHAFEGYFSAAAGGERLIDENGAALGSLGSTYFTQDATIYAHWGAATIDLPEPSRTGYSFLGWSTDRDAQTGFTGTYTVDGGESVTLYALWTEDPVYRIEYANVTGYNGPGVVKCGRWVEIPAPTKVGQTFAGWTITGAATSGVFHAASVAEQAGATPTTEALVGTFSDAFWKDLGSQDATVTLTANWRTAVYDVALDGNGATLAGTTNIYERYGSGMYLRGDAAADTVDEGAKMEQGRNLLTVPRREHMVSFAANAGEGEVVDGMPAAPQAFAYDFAGFYTAARGGTQVVTADGRIAPTAQEGGFFSSDSKLYAHWAGEGMVLSDARPTRTGYVFQGWNTAADGTGVSYGPGDTVIPESDLTLHAQWSRQTYVVTYNANGGYDAPATQTKTYDEELRLSEHKPSHDPKLDAGFVVTLDPLGGSVVVVDDVTQARDAKSVNELVPCQVYDPTSIEFVAWRGNDGTNTSFEPGASYTANADLALTAQWAEGAEQLGSIRLDSAARTGYRFLGWSEIAPDDPDDNASLEALGGQSLVTQSLVTQSIAPRSLKARLLAPLALASQPLSTQGDDQLMPEGEEYTPIDNLTLFANWERESYSFTLGEATGALTDGSTQSGTVLYGAPVTLSGAARDGWVWEGWVSSDESLVPSSTEANYTFAMPAGPITMTPKLRKANESEMTVAIDAHDFAVSLSEVAGLTDEQVIRLAGAKASNARGESLVPVVDRSKIRAEAGVYEVVFTTPEGTKTVTVKCTVRGNGSRNEGTGTSVYGNDVTLTADEIAKILAGDDASARLLELIGGVAYDASGNPVPVELVGVDGLSSKPGTYKLTLRTADGTELTVTVTVTGQEDGATPKPAPESESESESEKAPGSESEKASGPTTEATPSAKDEGSPARAPEPSAPGRSTGEKIAKTGDTTVSAAVVVAVATVATVMLLVAMFLRRRNRRE